MARPRQFDEVEVKSALSEVFWAEGYEGASYSGIMAATGLNKGSLYSSFVDKRALYLHAISEYKRAQLEPLLGMLRDEDMVAEALSALRKAITFCVKDTAAEDKCELIWTAYFGGQVMVKAGYSKALMRTQRTQVQSLFD